jgi:hypothetical protein
LPGRPPEFRVLVALREAPHTNGNFGPESDDAQISCNHESAIHIGEGSHPANAPLHIDRVRREAVYDELLDIVRDIRLPAPPNCAFALMTRFSAPVGRQTFVEHLDESNQFTMDESDGVAIWSE